MTANVTWSSAPLGIVTVSASGRVTAVAQGNSTVTARVGTIEATANVTVTPVPVASVAMSGVPSELETGEAKPLQATTRSAGGATLTGRAMTWGSSNEGAATVSQAGVVTGMAPGTTTITATSEGKSASVTIMVNTRAAFLAAIVDSVRNAFALPAIGAAITTRAGLFGQAAAGKRRMSLVELATTSDLWHIGSNLKAITGHVAAIAVGAGALSWNTTLAQAYPEFAATIRPEYQTVTLRMLLGHVGGIGELDFATGQTVAGNGSLTAQRANIAEWATSMAPAAAAGTYYYSNVGFMIAANMVERALGISWEDVMETRLLGPLGITAFGWGVAPWEQNQNPIGHQWTGGAWVENASDNPPYHSAAGRSHWSLAAWARVMQEILQADQGTSALVSQTAARVMTTAIAPNGYTGGWEAATGPWAQGRAVKHDGSNTWHYSSAQVALDRGAAIVVVTNATEPAGTRHFDALYALLARLWIYYSAHTGCTMCSEGVGQQEAQADCHTSSAGPHHLTLR